MPHYTVGVAGTAVDRVGLGPRVVQHHHAAHGENVIVGLSRMSAKHMIQLDPRVQLSLSPHGRVGESGLCHPS